MNEQKISTVLGMLVVFTVGVLIYNYFSSVNKTTKLVSEAKPEVKATIHTVKAGENLWQIAETYYNDGYKWTEISQANNLLNPDLLTEGQVLTLPEIETHQPEIAGAVTEIQKESLTQETQTPIEYTVMIGDSLWTISVKIYADGYQWTKIWEANKNQVANPDVIEPGTTLTIPR